VPERVRFRYRLEGLDKQWQDAGARHFNLYTRLDPGHYRFRVLACNNDGVWNEVGSEISLTVPPAYFQTSWFKFICVAAGVAVVWCIYLMRVRYLREELQGRLRERFAERERIARELHETLLQGIQGLVLRFSAATDRIASADPVRQLLDEALISADQAMRGLRYQRRACVKREPRLRAQSNVRRGPRR
jgi:signal transduction histidine kinase